MKRVVAPLATREFVKKTVDHSIAKAIAPLTTKKELADAIAPLATKKELAEAIAPLATKDFVTKTVDDAKVELHGAIAMVMKHIDARFVDYDKKVRAMFAETSKELAQHTQAILEAVRTMAKAVDDKYSDLPGRVSRLEAERGH